MDCGKLDPTGRRFNLHHSVTDRNGTPQLLRGGRGNASNGMILPVVTDKAFDTGLISFDKDLRLVCGTSLRDHYTNENMDQNFKNLEGKPLELPAGVGVRSRGT